MRNIKRRNLREHSPICLMNDHSRLEILETKKRLEHNEMFNSKDEQSRRISGAVYPLQTSAKFGFPF